VTPIPAITDIDQLKDRPAMAALLGWRREAVQGAHFAFDELGIWIERESLRDACVLLRDRLGFDFFSTVTCVDWHPSQPRFELIYQLLAMRSKQRLRLKVRVSEDDPAVDSVMSVWPAANYFEREVFDLFGIRFAGHPYLRRIMMPDDWQGHPLRKDYPVEGYR